MYYKISFSFRTHYSMGKISKTENGNHDFKLNELEQLAYGS